MIVASVLMSLGMMMLSPVLVALPFKLMLFVLADGWNLLLGSLAASFATYTPLEPSAMDSQQVFTAGQQGLMMLLMVSAPILLTVLVVGLVVSIFQAATQINEATLSFVPKIVAAVAVLAAAGPVDADHAGRVPAAVLQAIPGAVG
jgi:flagellar biosynthetic protein FliQ